MSIANLLAFFKFLNTFIVSGSVILLGVPLPSMASPVGYGKERHQKQELRKTST